MRKTCLHAVIEQWFPNRGEKHHSKGIYLLLSCGFFRFLCTTYKSLECTCRHFPRFEETGKARNRNKSCWTGI